MGALNLFDPELEEHKPSPVFDPQNAGMPTFSTAPQARDVYAPLPISARGELDPRRLPSGYFIDDASGYVIDPQGNPARTITPSAGEVASHVNSSIQPGPLAMAAGAARALLAKRAGGVEFGIFGGRGAKTADLEKLAIAENSA